jgi:septation ring formation regulator EzrA
MTLAIVLAVVAFLAVGILLARQTSRIKKSAIDDLKAEKKSVGKFDIFELVESEVTALGLLEIDGATDIPHAVLLKTWSDSSDVTDACVDRAHLRFVVIDGINPQDAKDEDVTMECSATK